MEDKNVQSQDGNLPANQQGQAGHTSRCARICGWEDRVANALVRRTIGNGASTAHTSSNGGPSTGPDSRRLRWLSVFVFLGCFSCEAACFLLAGRIFGVPTRMKSACPL